MAADLPSGTVTFLFTDIEGSTQLWEKFPKAMKIALARHDEILREAIKHARGHIIKTTGDGVHAAFETALEGVSAALNAQQVLAAEKWEEIEPHRIKVRMGIHTGEAQTRAGDYYGPAVNRAARLLTIGHGGQTLLSSTAADLVRDRLPEGASLRDLGKVRLKDLVRPEHVFQLPHPGLPAEFPPLRSIASHPNNLPVQLTSFIGRQRELAEAKSLLASARLLTLIGSGGTGKTRLALQIGADLLPNFADGVWLAELAPLAHPVLVLPTVASLLGLREQPDKPLNELLIDFLRDKELLLILDNCEHLLESCSKLADQLLHVCANLKIIGSSREPLGFPGETVYRVPSLSVPKPDEVKRETLVKSESAQLFIERAAAANRKFEVSDKNASSVAQICRRLDGIPLALELAAARVASLSVEQIAARLDDRFRLLTRGSRNALPRQQTLRALIDWSYDLLSDDERALMRRLSVFAGGWTLEAAESIDSLHDGLTLLTQLVNKSLVIFDEDGREPRYRMLETVRQYAREKLSEMGESQEAHNAHFNFILQFIETGGSKTEWLQDLDWVWRIEAEHDNLRFALEWGLEKNIEAVMRILWLVSKIWWLHGHETEGRHWATSALARADALPKIEGDEGYAQQRLRAYVYQTVAILASSQGDHAHLIEASEQAATLAEQLGDHALVAFSLSLMVLGKLFVGNAADTEQPTGRALAAARLSGGPFELGIALAAAGMRLYIVDGNSVRGHPLIEEAMQLLQQSGNRWAYSAIALELGMAAKFNDNYAEARQIFLSCEPLFRETGDRHRLNLIKSELAHLDRYEGRTQQAKATYQDTILEWKQIGHRAAVAHLLECLAAIAALEKQSRRAAYLFGAAESLRERIEIPMTALERMEYNREIADLKAGLDEKIFAASWDEGRKMNMDQAIDFARE